MVAWLTGIGIAVEIAGLGVTAWGIAETWRTNSHDERFVDPILRALFRAGRWLNGRLPARLRRTPERPGEMRLTASLGGRRRSGSGTVNWTPAFPDLPIEEQVAELDARLRRLAKQHHRGRADSKRELRRLEDTTGRIEGSVDELKHHVAETARALRVEGLRMQACGLALVALGLLLQVPGQFGGGEDDAALAELSGAVSPRPAESAAIQ